MPEGTPFTKVGRTEALGAQVVLSGDGLAETHDAAQQYCEAKGQTFAHPYDYEQIIAGQGTVGLELLSDAQDLNVVVVPIGGGGLLAGTAAAKALKPDIEIIGVEAALYPSMIQALDKGDALSASGKGTGVRSQTISTASPSRCRGN